MKLGFPTGKLSGMPLAKAVARNVAFGGRAIEVTAMRYSHMDSILGQMKGIAFPADWAVSLHLPSRILPENERHVIDMVSEDRHGLTSYPVVIHPDTISDWSMWRSLGRRVRIENMDLRKSYGINGTDIAESFDRLPEARWCFDIGHARQVDPTMGSARELLGSFLPLLSEMHISVVNPCGKHSSMTRDAVVDYRECLRDYSLPHDLAVIIEVPCNQHEMGLDYQFTRLCFP